MVSRVLAAAWRLGLLSWPFKHPVGDIERKAAQAVGQADINPNQMPFFGFLATFHIQAAPMTLCAGDYLVSNGKKPNCCSSYAPMSQRKLCPPKAGRGKPL